MCFIILNIGKYRFLDVMMKVIIITLTLTTLIATAMAIYNSSEAVSFTQLLPEGSIEITFLIAFMGWMPAPLDISVWHSLWTTEKQKTSTEKRNPKTALLDFNIGYLGTILLGVSFVALARLSCTQQAIVSVTVLVHFLFNLLKCTPKASATGLMSLLESLRSPPCLVPP